FSLFRSAKLMSLHYLAVLRHAERRWGDAVVLSRGLLSQRLGSLCSLSKPAKLILAESLLETGELRGTAEALSALGSEKLALSEALKLQSVLLDYQSRLGAFD